MQSDKMYCPIVEKKIDDEICIDVAHVAEDFHPERFAPQEFRDVQNYKKICQKCRNNPFN